MSGDLLKDLEEMSQKKDTGIWIHENGYDFYKDNPQLKIWDVEAPDEVGVMLFSFDKKHIFNFFQDFPAKLTPEQVEIFRKEKPELAALRPA